MYANTDNLLVIRINTLINEACPLQNKCSKERMPFRQLPYGTDVRNKSGLTDKVISRGYLAPKSIRKNISRELFMRNLLDAFVVTPFLSERIGAGRRAGVGGTLTFRMYSSSVWLSECVGGRAKEEVAKGGERGGWEVGGREGGETIRRSYTV